MGILRERTAARELDLLVPGDLQTRTGGYIYDRHMVDGLRRLGWRVQVHGLDASFPQPTAAALRQAGRILASIPAARIVLIDGLALGGLAKVLAREASRLLLLALIHHPLALETGLDAKLARRLKNCEREALAMVRGVIVTSSWTLRALAAYSVPASRIRVVEPGVESLQQSERSPGTVDRPLNLLCVATLTPRKGHSVLINALALIRDRRWRLRCVGSLKRDAATARSLQEQIARLRLRSRISLLGELDDPSLDREYARADVFVLASYMEGYGMALADALARGIAIVSTEVGAIPETVPANAGLLVQPGDEGALAEALAAIMDDPQLRRRLTANALAAGRNLPDWDDASQRFAAALDDLAGKS